MEGFFKNTKLAAGLSVVSNLTLIILKLVAGFISGSISIISEAIHSGSDFLASVIAFYAVHKSDQPADEGHQFGHGKYEDVAGFVEGCLIILASLYIIYEASKKTLRTIRADRQLCTGCECNVCISMCKHTCQCISH